MDAEAADSVDQGPPADGAARTVRPRGECPAGHPRPGQQHGLGAGRGARVPAGGGRQRRVHIHAARWLTTMYVVSG